MARIVNIPNVKTIRAKVIQERLPAGVSRVVCLSCGNATRALERVLKSVQVVVIDPRSPVAVNREITVDDIWRFFGPDCFNATSGYLPMDWIEAIGQRLKPHIPEANRYYVPVGSGETMLALSCFIPLSRLIGVTATYPPLTMMGPLSRWLQNNAQIHHAGRVDSVASALNLVARKDGLALCWESKKLDE